MSGVARYNRLIDLLVALLAAFLLHSERFALYQCRCSQIVSDEWWYILLVQRCQHVED